jgi:hypothetical protein
MSVFLCAIGIMLDRERYSYTGCSGQGGYKWPRPTFYLYKRMAALVIQIGTQFILKREIIGDSIYITRWALICRKMPEY